MKRGLEPIKQTNEIRAYKRTRDVPMRTGAHPYQVQMADVSNILGIIYYKTVDEQKKHVEIIITYLMTAGVTKKIRKCDFFKSTIEYLG